MSGVGLQAISVVGGVVPPSLFARLRAGEAQDRESLSPSSYRLAGNETTRDAANRSWNYLLGAWQSWRDQQLAQPAGMGDTRAHAVRERWMLVLLRDLGYGQLQAVPAGLAIGSTTYPASHAWQHVAVHLVGPGVDLDRRNPGVAGAARAPQAMLQELLNRSPDHLWAILSNGRRLRILRDSTALAGSAYIQFDLEAMFEGELFAEFLLMWQVLQFSRLEKRGGPDASPADCWLEDWRVESIQAGTRALDKLRDGVERAVVALGTGFLVQPANEPLRQSLAGADGVDVARYHRHLLRLVYRLLFLCVAEDRDGALLDPEASPRARERYLAYFSMARLRRLSRVRVGSSQHTDLWSSVRLVLSALGGDGERALGLPALGGIFDPPTREDDFLLEARLGNEALLAAVRSLGWVGSGHGKVQAVDYRNLGAEELGSVYESLLELVPRVDLSERTFGLEHVAGNERKTTGSYYTPPGLVSALLDTALDPLLDDTVKNAVDTNDAVERLLALTVCDPACGSGHFLVAAARRIARRIAQLRSTEDEPTEPEVRHAIREVVGKCIYGVDVNPMAAELAKVSLWLEALEPGKPLGFLDARIRVGNSLLGTTPALVDGGIPDDAFKELEGDDKKVAASVRRRNRAERAGQDTLFASTDELDTGSLAADRAEFIRLEDDVAMVRAQASRWRAYEESAKLRRQLVIADTWTAAFVWPLHAGAPEPPTARTFDRVRDDPDAAVIRETVQEAERLADAYGFFQWHLEFPEIFDGEVANGAFGRTGFDAVVGNPPFRGQLNSGTSSSTRERRLLRVTCPAKLGPYTDVSAIFLVRSVQLVRPAGRVGLVQPQSIVSSRDGHGVRQFAQEHAALVAFWSSNEHVFEASVTTVFVIFLIEVGPMPIRVHEGPNFTFKEEVSADLIMDGTWAPLVARRLGVPTIATSSGERLVRIATATADFRDQYYGLIGYVHEADVGRPDWAPLVTTGLVQPGQLHWGRVATRHNKVKWSAPMVDVAHLRSENRRMGDWAHQRLVPKVLVATQGRVIEAVADHEGSWLPCVPIISVMPREDDAIWQVLAVLLSPTASAWAYSQAAGSALASTGLKVSAKQVASIPLPSDTRDWRRAAQVLAEDYEPGFGNSRLGMLEAAHLMTAAYMDDTGVHEWWVERAFGSLGTQEADLAY